MSFQFEEVYRWRKTDYLTPDTLNVRFQNIDNRFSKLEDLSISWNAALLVVQDKVLEQSEAVLEGLRVKAEQITDMDWLIALSGSSLTLVENTAQSLIIGESSRDLFTPGPYSVISRASSPDDWAVVQTIQYDKTTFQWDFHTLSVNGNPGPHTDWVIAAIAGSTLAQYSLVQAGYDSRDAAAASAAAAASDTATVASDKATVASDKALANQAKTDAQTAAAAAAASAVAAATWDPSSYYNKTTIDAKFSALIGTADTAGDTLGELESLISTVSTSVPTRGKIVGLSYGDGIGF